MFQYPLKLLEKPKFPGVFRFFQKIKIKNIDQEIGL